MLHLLLNITNHHIQHPSSLWCVFLVTSPKTVQTNISEIMMKESPPPPYPTRSRVGRCAGRNPSSVRGGIQLYGLPASQAGHPRRLFALPPRRVGRLTQARSVLNLLSVIACHGRCRLCPLPALSPYTSRCRGPARWMEFPQAPEGPKAAHRLTDHDTQHKTTG